MENCPELSAGWTTKMILLEEHRQQLLHVGMVIQVPTEHPIPLLDMD